MRRPNTECRVCSSPIYRRPAQIESGKVFCSLQCTGHFSRKSTQRKCICGVELTDKRYACSRSCANKRRAGVVYRVGQPKNRAENVKRLKRELIELRGSKCERCPYAFTEVLQAHHIVQRKDGGSDDLDNLELICPNCHSEEHYYRKIGRGKI